MKIIKFIVPILGSIVLAGALGLFIGHVVSEPTSGFLAFIVGLVLGSAGAMIGLAWSLE